MRRLETRGLSNQRSGFPRAKIVHTILRAVVCSVMLCLLDHPLLQLRYNIALRMQTCWSRTLTAPVWGRATGSTGKLEQKAPRYLAVPFQ